MIFPGHRQPRACLPTIVGYTCTRMESRYPERGGDMLSKMRRLLVGTALAGAVWLGRAKKPPAQDPPLNRFFYYPYYYFPHNYWPSQGPAWPEPARGCDPCARPPAYMSYPPYKEPGWRYDFFEPHHHYRGFHF